MTFKHPATELFNIVYQLPSGAGACDAGRLKGLAELGLRAVATPSDLEADGLRTLAERCAHAGLKVGAVNTVHAPKAGEGLLTDVVLSALRAAGEIGAAMVRVETPALNGLNERDEVEEALRQLRELEAVLEAADIPEIPVGLEPESGALASMTGARDVFHELDSERLGVSINPAKITTALGGSEPPAGGDHLRFNLRRFLSCYFFSGYRRSAEVAVPCNLWNGDCDFVSVIFKMHFSRGKPPEHIIVEDPAIECLLDGDDRDLFYIRNMLSALAEYSFGHPGLKAGDRNLANVAERVEWGRTELIPDRSFPVASHVVYTLRVTVGPGGVEPGGEIRIQHPHLWKAGAMQTGFPEREGYVSVTASRDDVELMLFPRPYALSELVIGVASGGLREGDALEVLMGDTSAGGPGIVSNKDMVDLAFTVAVRPSAEAELLVTADAPVLRITNGPAARLAVIAPSIVEPGGDMPVVIRAEDGIGYPCVTPGELAYSGRLELGAETAGADAAPRELPDDLAVLTEADAGVTRRTLPGERGIAVSGRVCRILVRDRQSGLAGRSNPVSCRENPERRLYWGEIHSHSTESDGRLPIDFLYRYARDYAALDFASSGDHALANHPEKWETAKEYAARYHQPHRFVTLLGSEFSWPAPYGDRNAYFKTLDVPCLKSRRIEDVWDWVAGHGGMLIPHQLAAPAMAIDWGYHDPRVERLVEVTSCHGNFEKPDVVHGFSPRHGIGKGLLSGGSYYQDALARGYRLGVIGSSDAHDTHTGHTPYGSWRGTPLAAVWAGELTRESIFQAMWDRRCYATSGARIILETTVNGSPLGSEISRAEGSTEPVRVQVSVVGTAEISKVDVIRNNVDVHTVSPESEAVSFEFCDDLHDTPLAREVYYYVRVTQSDGEMAWSSPVWVVLNGVREG